jgi:predicted GIY-YIG superfamily endonuclease
MQINSKLNSFLKKEKYKLSSEISKDFYCVYWIRENSFSSLDEGYIGITKDFHKRMKEHKYYSCNKNLKSKKWETLVQEKLFTGTKNQCLDIEFLLRKEMNIGWNIAKGGNIPICTEKTIKKSIKTKRENNYYSSRSFKESRELASHNKKLNNKIYNIPILAFKGNKKFIFESIYLAAKYFNTKPHNILKVLRGELKTLFNLEWKLDQKDTNIDLYYNKLNLKNPLKSRDTRRQNTLKYNKPIYCFNKAKEFIVKYNSVIEAESEGYDLRSIMRVLEGKRKSYNTMLWSYNRTFND